MATQLITPNAAVPCRPGYCLEYVRETFGLPIRYGSATEAWEKSASQHRDRNIPAGMWAPVYFSIDVEPNGHIALQAPDGSIYSSSDLTSTPHHHPDIEDLIAYYARWGKMQLVYLGWTEDVAGYPVISLEGAGPLGLSPQSITQLQEAGIMAQLDNDDRVFVQTVIHTDTDRAILDNRAQVGAAANAILKAIAASAWDIKTFEQAVDNGNGDREIDDQRQKLAAAVDEITAALHSEIHGAPLPAPVDVAATITTTAGGK
jgi:hypothetical protein